MFKKLAGRWPKEVVVDLAGGIRTKRQEFKLSQDALARRADVSLSLINQMERGLITDPHYSTLSRIAAALGTSVSELVGEVDPKAQAALPRAQRRGYPYLWMSDTLAETIRRWQDKSLDPGDPKHSYVIAVACLDIMWHILRYDVPGETLKDRVPADEYEERIKLVDMLSKIAQLAQDHYVGSKEADAAEVESLKERFENVVPLRVAG